MKKTLLTVLSMALATSMMADNYYFSPKGQGEEDGSSWTDAASGEDYLGQTLENAMPGDTLFLMEGNYTPDIATNKWIIPEGVVLMGGFPTTMTGTGHAYDYAQGGQSVFSADLDGDGKGDNTNYAFVYIGKGDATEKDDFYYKDFQPTSIWGITFRDGMRLNSKYWGNMVFVKHAQVDFHFCQFLNNDSQTNDDANGSNGAIEIWGSLVRCFDCIFRDNVTAKGSGAAFQVRGRNSDSGTHADSENSLVMMNRCEFQNNIAFSTLTSTPTDAKWGTYGGNCSIADNGGTLYMINCTVANSKCWYRGVGIRVSTNDKAYFINNTFYDNPSRQGTDGATNNGMAISAGTGASCYFANNIMVEYAANDLYVAGNAEVYLQSPTTLAVSAGHNIYGTVTDNGDNLKNWPATDSYPTSLATVNTIEMIFGTNALTNNGGFSRTIAPLATAPVSGMVVSDMQTAVATWPLDAAMAAVLDVDKDQRGYTRAATTVSGAYDPNGVAPEPPVEDALEDVVMPLDMNAPMYNVLGVQVDKSYQGIVLQNGQKYMK